MDERAVHDSRFTAIMTILLIGCGNPLRRDDGAAPLLVRRIGRSCRWPELETIVCHQLMPELAPRLAAPAVGAVIFADTAIPRSGEPTGVLLRQLFDLPASTPLGHRLGPARLLALAARLYGRRPPAWLVTIPGEDFGVGRGLSRSARYSLQRAEEKIERLLTAGIDAAD